MNSLIFIKLIASFWYCSLQKEVLADGGYLIGVGRGDITGPPVEVVFMGYANVKQRGIGLHLRQYSRAFIVDSDGRRATFVNIDAAMLSHSMKRDVIAKLEKLYGKTYTNDNVIISATHTHGAPGGYMFDVLYDFSNFGFVQETYHAMVNGIYRSIVNAHENLQPGRLYIDETEVLDANINRSPTSYLNNPIDERAQFKYDVDKTLTQLRFVDNTNEVIGAINWYAVHPTSMNNSNLLVSSDNVGYASILLEKHFNPDNLAGRGKFVGAFASSNLGDVSPNIMGPKCSVTAEICDIPTSSCPPKHGECFAVGPGNDDFESTKMIATRLFKGALEILKEQTGREVKGDVKFIHQYIDMPNARASFFNTKTKQIDSVKGCVPAMGYSFAAGTIDGPGFFDFHQGTTTDNPLWNAVRDFLAKPRAEDVLCQAPKPILLATGRCTFPYEWQPTIVTTQAFQIGDIAIVAVPGEFTTMSGRRLRNEVRNAILQAGGEDMQVILAGLSNMYTSYIATPEEYEIQRYEGASTIFGPHTLTIYIEQFQRIVQAMVKNEVIPRGPNPPSFDDKVISFQTGVLMDTAPYGKKFGDVVQHPKETYRIGETVMVRFVSGNPRNDLQHEKTYLTVERINPDGNWVVVAVDSDWDTWFEWRNTSFFWGQSVFEAFWHIGQDVEIGTYRIRHFGAYKRFWSSTHAYTGTSRTFAINK